MEQIIKNKYVSKKYTIETYEDSFRVFIKKKRNWLFAYSEILTIKKDVYSFNGGVTFRYHIIFKPLDGFKERAQFTFNLRKPDINLETMLNSILNLAYSEDFKNKPYPIEVKNDRSLHSKKRPFGTRGWEKLYLDDPTFGGMLLGFPVVNFITIPWFVICLKHFHY